MEIPEDLEKLANDLYAKRLAEERKDQEKERARRAAEEAARKKRIEEGLSYAQFILEWVKEFKDSAVGKLIIKICEWTYLRGIMFFDDKVKGKPFRGLGVSAKGLWWMSTGCGSHPRIVQFAEELAAEIDPEILQAACESIKSGKVWECIKNRWELNERK